MLAAAALAQPTAADSAGTRPASASPGTDALDDFLDNVQTLNAQFSQEIWTAEQELLESAVGTMALARPDRFYWHYETPVETIVVADGEALWMYDVELEQVSVTPLDEIAAANPALLLSGGEDLRERFEVERSYRMDDQDWVELVPKAAGGDFSSVLIAFRDGLPRQLELVDGLDQTTRIVFEDVEVNVAVDESLFEFEPPPGADVIGSLD